MVEDREIVIKLSGDRGEYGTVTVPAPQLDSAWVEQEIRRVYEAGGLPTFMVEDLARRVVEDVKAREEERLGTEAAGAPLDKEALTAGTAPSADVIGFIISSSIWNDRNFHSLRPFYYYCWCYFVENEGFAVGRHVIGTEEELSELVANYGDCYNTLLVFVHGFTIGGRYHAEQGLRLERVAETCDAIMPVGPGRKAVIINSCSAERIPGYYPGVEVMGARVYALNAGLFASYSYEKGAVAGAEYEKFGNVIPYYGGIEIWGYLNKIYNVGTGATFEYIIVDSAGRVVIFKPKGREEVDYR
jgi:hypothetical protein